jgi:hypothetical protein
LHGKYQYIRGGKRKTFGLGRNAGGQIKGARDRPGGLSYNIENTLNIYLKGWGWVFLENGTNVNFKR